MLIAVDCPTADVSAYQLGLRLNGPLPEVLVERSYRSGEYSLSLGVIGASHVATLAGPLHHFREEISCFAHEAGEALPVEKMGRRYALCSEVLRPSDFDQAASELIANAEQDDWLLARFPGVGEYHVTAVNGWFESGSWRWETMHMYPGEGTIVRTKSRYKL